MTSLRRATALAFIAFATAHPAQAADAVTLQLDWVPGGIAAPWFYGISQHCFSDRDISLKITRGYGAGDAITKVAAGASPFGVTDFGAMIAVRAKTGAPVKALMPISSVSPFAVAVMDTAPIGSLKDLEGKKVAASPGDAGMQFLPVGMRIEGADFTKVNKMSVETATLAGLLIQGKIDAITTYVTTAVSVNEAAMQVGRKIKVIPFGQKLEIYNVSLFTSDALIQSNPDLVHRMTDAAKCSFDKARANPDASIDAIVDQVSGLQRESQVALVPFSYNVAFDNPVFAANGYTWNMDRVAHTVAIVKEAQGIQATLDPADFIYR